ncbi:MAG TPA: NAD-dependent epimerase/dehydratase family protein [Candidatus Sumerlaeota bacterium]|nr:NAD-dependent epimerase/dehydratase family protein [Candidatus Sumerlaeota bacterium]
MTAQHVLVTGGAGFIGSHIVDALLERGHRVRVLDSLDPQVHGPGADGPPAYLNPAVEFVRGDVRDADALDRALDGIEVVFHQAAAVGVAQSMYAIRAYTDTNVMGTATLLELIVGRHRDHVRKMVVASSMSIYGEGKYLDPETNEPVRIVLRDIPQMEAGQWEPVVPGTHRPATPVPCDELKPLMPTSVYAVNKRDQEEMVLTTGLAYGIPAVALRYFNVYGPRQALSNPYTGVAAIFSSALMNGRGPLVFEDGRQSRDFIHVRDIARANVLAMDSDAADYQAINIGTGRPTSILQVARLLLERLHPDRRDDPQLQPRIVGKYRAGDIRHCYADIARARALLGFEPSITYEQGLDELIEWVRTQRPEDKSEQAYRELADRKLV